MKLTSVAVSLIALMAINSCNLKEDINNAMNIDEKPIYDALIPINANNPGILNLKKKGILDNLKKAYSEINIDDAQMMRYKDFNIIGITFPVKSKDKTLSYSVFIDSANNIMQSLVFDVNEVRNTTDKLGNLTISGKMVVYAENGEMLRTVVYNNSEIISTELGNYEHSVALSKKNKCMSCFLDCVLNKVPWYYVAACGAGCATNPFICAACVGMGGGICAGTCGCKP